MARITGMAIVLLAPLGWLLAQDAELERIIVAADKRGFALESSRKAFIPWGFNYDHDDDGALLEDYWEKDWERIAKDFRDMKRLGANVARIHLQVGKFMDGPEQPSKKALDRLDKLLRLAEKVGLYLDLTGLGCYHKKDVPAWYDKLPEKNRWETQARFWEAVARVGRSSPAVFCYDLMNEPVVAGGPRKDGDWLGPPFGGKHFVQFIALDPGKRPRHEVARQWIRRMVTGIRKHDRKALITVGLVDWSLDRPGLTSGFVPAKIAADLDFLCVHLYPEKGKVGQALATLEGFAIGKPVLVEETFPLRCSITEFDLFMSRSRKHAAGWLGFYWGKTPEELQGSKDIRHALMRLWLVYFQKNAKKFSG